MALDTKKRFLRPDLEAIRPADSAMLRRRALAEGLICACRTPFYAQRLRGLPDDVGPEALADLPFTTRQDLVDDQAAFPRFGRFHAISTMEAALIGRSGVGFSATRRRLNLLASSHDIRRQAGLFARVLFEAGVRSTHRVYIADDPRYNLLAMYAMHAVAAVGGMIVYTAAERSARTARYVVPTLPPDHVFLTPTYAHYFATVLAERSGGRWPIRSVSGWGEPGYSAPHVRERLQRLWTRVSDYPSIAIVDAYGLSETGLIAMGCREGKGLHVFEDACWIEVVEPDGERVLGAGEVGEVVVTRLGSSGAPLVRYRTGDVAVLDARPCPCGRAAPRLTRVQRLSERLSVDGRAVYPLDVEEALVRAGAWADVFLLEREDGRVHVRCSGTQGLGDAPQLSRRLTADLGVPVVVDVETAEALPPFLHKAFRVVADDSRDSYRAELEFQRELEHI
jgi:phenylacetate-CoA ligase